MVVQSVGEGPWSRWTQVYIAQRWGDRRGCAAWPDHHVIAPRIDAVNAPDRSDHVPGTLVYGPVDSRRFGRSLGVSFSYPGVRACAWRCPYCQLGHLPAGSGEQLAPLAELQRETATVLEGAGPAAIDTITMAGGGEPTDHPAFADYVAWLADRVAAEQVRLVLLSNGDGLVDDANLAACDRLDEVYIKWDPGAPQGSWSTAIRDVGIDRGAVVSRLRPLRLQTLVFHLVGGDGGGNAGDALRDRWIEEVRPLAPACVHLTTVDRTPPTPSIRAVPVDRLQAWADHAQTALGVPVIAYP